FQFTLQVNVGAVRPSLLGVITIYNIGTQQNSDRLIVFLVPSTTRSVLTRTPSF
ncbi:unnamed protein product, partial [Hymenolepis diminuta]